MQAKILNGKIIRDKIISGLKTKVSKSTRKPGLAVILVGNDQASKIYVTNKEKACRQIGYYSRFIKLPKNVGLTKLLETIKLLNRDKQINGILVQFPLPKNLAVYEKQIILAIDPIKDVDAFHPLNAAELFYCQGEIYEKLLLPCTPSGIIKLLKEYKIPIAGRHAVIVGRSNLVGKPTALLLLAENATVTICHSKTNNLSQITKQADILITAIGKPKFFDEKYIKPQAVVIDVGINRSKQGLIGDVDFTRVLNIASAITPVPGGIGPMTIAALVENVWKAYKAQTSN